MAAPSGGIHRTSSSNGNQAEGHLAPDQPAANSVLYTEPALADTGGKHCDDLEGFGLRHDVVGLSERESVQLEEPGRNQRAGDAGRAGRRSQPDRGGRAVHQFGANQEDQLEEVGMGYLRGCDTILIDDFQQPHHRPWKHHISCAMRKARTSGSTRELCLREPLLPAHA